MNIIAFGYLTINT